MTCYADGCVLPRGHEPVPHRAANGYEWGSVVVKSTYRERRMAKAERLREWAGSREQKSEASLEKARQIADGIPFGQPILVGHHSEGRHRRDVDRIERGMRRGLDDAAKAEEFRDRADNIEAAARQAVYDDDPDAVERLEEKVVRLKVERDRIKAFNASCRKGEPDESLLDERQRRNLASTRASCPMFLGKGGSMPAYALTNLSANINRLRKRAESLRRSRETVEQGGRDVGKAMLSRYGGTCPACGEDFAKGDPIIYYRATREALHAACRREE